MHAEFQEFDLTVFERQMNINFKAPVHLVKYALPHIIETKGKICGISSLLGVGVAPRNTAYCASKHALNAFLHSLRPEVARHGVSVTVICPGPVDTEILQNLDGSSGSIVGMNLDESAKRILWSAEVAGERCAASTERGVSFDGFPFYLWWFVRSRTLLTWFCDTVFAHIYTTIDLEEKRPTGAAENNIKAANSGRIASNCGSASNLDGASCETRDAWELPDERPSGFDAITGPGRLPLETLCVNAGLILPVMCVCGHAFFSNAEWSVAQHATAAFLAGDLFAGVVIFTSSTGKRWWHREERRTFEEQMKYIALVGLHPFLVAMFFRSGSLAERALWYAVSWGYLVIAVMIIMCAPLYYRRMIAACLFSLSLMIEPRMAFYTPLLEWVLPLYYFKYICCYPVREEPYRPDVAEHVKAE